MRTHAKLRHAKTLTALVAAAALAAPATASAASLTYEGDALVYRAAPGELNFVHLGIDGGRFAVGDSGGGAISFPADRCTQLSPEYSVYCDMPARVRAELGDGADNAFARSYEAMPAVEIFGGDGNDRLKSAESATAALYGEAGDDKLESEDAGSVLAGGPGSDELLGGGGNDSLQGGEGDDYLRPDNNSAAPGNDLVDGGPGTDLVEDWVDNSSAGTQRTVTVTLDGQANDGRPGESDDVRDVEHVRTFVAGRWVMGDGPDRVESWASTDQGPSTIEGRGGDDVLLSGNGSQALDGGAGNDRLEAGFGDDTITGGPGRDTIVADFTGSQCGVLQSCTIPHGNDTVLARDGEADTIDCGVGNDRAVVDPQDVVNGCEQVEVGVAAAAGGPAQGKPAGKPGAGAGAGADADGSADAGLTIDRRKLGVALRRGLVVRLSGMRPGPVSVRALRGARTVARGSARAGEAGAATVTVRFTKAARRSLARNGSVRLVVVAGALRRAVTLRR